MISVTIHTHKMQEVKKKDRAAWLGWHIWQAWMEPYEVKTELTYFICMESARNFVKEKQCKEYVVCDGDKIIYSTYENK